MICTQRKNRPHVGRWSPRVEGLETRRLFSVSAGSSLADAVPFSFSASSNGSSSTALQGPNLTVVRTDPAAGASLLQAPTSLTIAFDRPVDPLSLQGIDVQLERVNNDGSVVPLFDRSHHPAERFNASMTELRVELNTPLGVGHYRIVLLGASGLAGADGAYLANPWTDQSLGDFSVDSPGVTLADATNLGTPGTKDAPSVTAGSLDFQANPLAVDLYKISLPAGHFWRLGVEVSAHRDGGTLDSSLALFDAQGKPIATGNLGAHDVPSDPYLFAGLQPGTYYIGVSGAGNRPGPDGGYDPASGRAGSVSQSQSGGAYRLHLVADPADAPTHLASFHLNQADPNDATPTGMTLTFSGALNPVSLQSDPFQALQVVDQSGKVWPMTPVGYQESGSLYTFLFDQKLPAGQYSLVVPKQGGATDLAGLTPVAPGEPNGVLATWTVAASNQPNDPNDLGTLLRDAHSGISRDVVLPANGSQTYRFVVAFTGNYEVETSYTGGSLAIQRTSPDGTVSYDPGRSDQYAPKTNEMYLPVGVYDLRLTATGSQAVHVDLTIKLINNKWESVLVNGVGQAPALNLTLVAPLAPIGPFGGSSGPGTATPTPSATSTASTSSTVSASALTTSSGQTGLLLALGNNLVGSPSVQAEHVAAVGPGVHEGTTTLALNATGLLQGIIYGSKMGRSSPIDRDEAGDSSEVEVLAPINGAMIVRIDTAEVAVDDQGLDISGWLGRISPIVENWFSASLSDSPPPRSDADPAPETVAETIELSRDDEPDRSDQVEEANFSSPLGVGVISVMALRLHQPFCRWIGRYRAQAGGQRFSRAQSKKQGPHTRI